MSTKQITKVKATCDHCNRKIEENYSGERPSDWAPKEWICVIVSRGESVTTTSYHYCPACSKDVNSFLYSMYHN